MTRTQLSKNTRNIPTKGELIIPIELFKGGITKNISITENAAERESPKKECTRSSLARKGEEIIKDDPEVKVSTAQDNTSIELPANMIE